MRFKLMGIIMKLDEDELCKMCFIMKNIED